MPVKFSSSIHRFYLNFAPRAEYNIVRHNQVFTQTVLFFLFILSHLRVEEVKFLFDFQFDLCERAFLVATI